MTLIACVQTSPISFVARKGNWRRLHAGRRDYIPSRILYTSTKLISIIFNFSTFPIFPVNWSVNSEKKLQKEQLYGRPCGTNDKHVKRAYEVLRLVFSFGKTVIIQRNEPKYLTKLNVKYRGTPQSFVLGGSAPSSTYSPCPFINHFKETASIDL